MVALARPMPLISQMTPVPWDYFLAFLDGVM